MGDLTLVTFRAHSRCRIYDCRRFPRRQSIGQLLVFVGESIYAGLGGIGLKDANNRFIDTSPPMANDFLRFAVVKNDLVIGNAR